MFEARLAAVEAVVQNQDNREHDILDSDDYYQFEGGMTAAVRVLSGRSPPSGTTTTRGRSSPAIRTLREEVARVVRARVVNPKWIAGVMRHGYKGAFEMAATVDYLFAFAATAHCVEDHHFDAVYDAYVEDDAVRCVLPGEQPRGASRDERAAVGGAGPGAVAAARQRCPPAAARTGRCGTATIAWAGRASVRSAARPFVQAMWHSLAAPRFCGSGVE